MGCALTNGGDKLRAIYSVAKEIMSATGWEYIHFAGMWRHTLAYELLWCMPMDDVARPLRSRALSWSWAAIDGNSVILQAKPRKPSTAETLMPEAMKAWVLRDHFQILDVYEKRPGHTSDNVRGYLEVMALTKPISSIVEDTSQSSLRMAIPYNFFCENKGNLEVQDGDIDDVPAMEKVFAHGRLDSKPSGQSAGNSKLFYMHIGVDTHWNGLIVERYLDAVSPSIELWRRVGVAQLFGRDGSSLMPDVFNTVDSRVKLVLV